MANEWKNSHSRCAPDLVPADTVNSGLSRGVFPSTDERKLEINFFTTHSDSLASKEGASIGECNSMGEVGSSSSSMPKKSAWNKPCVVSEAGGIVMGADSWPTLSESARASPKSPSAYPTKSVSNGPLIPPQGIDLGSSSTSKEVGFRNLTQKSISMHVGPTRQRSVKHAAVFGDGHGAGGSSSHAKMPANGSLSPEVSHLGSVKGASSSPLTDGSIGESAGDAENDGGQRVASHGRNEQQQSQHNGSSRNNNGPQFRGNGSHHHSNAGRRDLHRGFNNKGNHGPHQRGSRPLTLSPTPNTQYYFYQLPYPTMPPYVHPEMTPYFWHPPLDPWRPPMSPISIPPMFVPMPDSELPLPSNILKQDSELSLPSKILKREPELPMSPKISKLDQELSLSPKMLKPDPELLSPKILKPNPDLPLPSKILNQIDYYFSLDNLVKDTYLRKNMDAQGWVSIDLIANFNKVIGLTDNVQDILDAIRASNIVEVQDNKVRCRENWQKWIMTSTQHSPPTSPRSNPSQNSLTDQLSHLNLN